MRFALDYQARLRELSAATTSTVASRVGIHLGEVVLRENSQEDVARGAKPLEVEGLAKAVAARVMSLAGDGRILLTRTAYDFARRAAVGASEGAQPRWAVHRRYRLKGVEDLLESCEVAAPGAAALAPPPRSEKANRVADDAAPVAAAAAAAEPVLAVLAFDNLSTDPEMQFFPDGVSEEIIQRLARGAKLKVIGRTSSFQFRGERKAGRGKGATGQAAAQTDECTPADRRAAMTWAQRLKRVFGIDIDTCSQCGGAMRSIACIEDRVVIEKILAHLDAKAAAAQAARPPPSRAPPRRPLGLHAPRSPASSPRLSSLAALHSRPAQGIGCARAPTRSGSRRARAGLAAGDLVAAAISRTQLRPAGLRCRFPSPWTERGWQTRGRARALSGRYSSSCVGLPVRISETQSKAACRSAPSLARSVEE